MSVSVAKNYVAVVVDVSAAEDCAIDERKKKLVQTVEAAKSVLKFKSMFSPKNSILIVCVGTKETNNDLSDDDGYNNISVVQPLSMIEGSSFNALETSKVLAAPAAGDVLSGVVVALELLKGADKPPSGRMPPKELIIISDGGTPADDNPDSIMSIAGQLTGNKISTSLITMGFSNESTTRSPTQSALLALALASNAGVVSASSGVEAWAGLSQLSRGTRTSMRGTLDIGDLHIPVHTYSRVKQTKLPSLSKRSALGSDTAEVSLERFKTQRTAEGEEVVPEEELVKAYAYGKDLFTVDEAQQQLMKYTSIKELAVLAFVPRSTLRVHWFLDTVETVTPEPGDPNAFTALASLAESLAASGKVGLCRFVPRTNAAPQLVAMLPPDHAATPAAPADAGGDAVGTVEADKSRSILYLVSLPFAEDMRDFPFPVLETLPGAPSDTQLDATAALIDALDMDAVPATAAGGDDAEAGGSTLGEATAALPNPTLQRLADTLALRASGQTDAIAPVPEAVAQLLQPNDALFAKAGSAVEGFKGAFPLSRVAGGKRSREAFGGAEDMDMFADLDAFVGGAGSEADPKAQRTDGGAAASSSSGAAAAGVFSSMAQTRVQEIGTVQPKENLSAMLAQGDSPDRAIGMFVAAVQSMLASPAGVERALECLQFVRPLAVQHGVVSAFNSCLEGIRSAGKDALSATPAQQQAWARLQELHMAPVSVTEAPTAAGAASVAEAQAFFAAAPASFAAPSMTQSGPVDAGGDDSDFDDLS